jgi:type IV secretion system protein VirB2
MILGVPYLPFLAGAGSCLLLALYWNMFCLLLAPLVIAVIFAGYQIAFAHKRISDVAPILVGGFLIGAAAQIARMLVGDAGGAVAMVTQLLPGLYA